MNSIIILAGGDASRIGADKGLIMLAGKPLIQHVYERIVKIGDEVIIVLKLKEQREAYSKFLTGPVKFAFDECEFKSPLVGFYSGLKHAEGDYSLALPCDTPFVSEAVAKLLLDLCLGRDAVIPRWPNGYIEPLQAAYNTKTTLKAAESALRTKQLNMRGAIDRLERILYISTTAIKSLDPELKTLFNVNTPLDLEKAQLQLRRERSTQPPTET